ncbi:uncharacterized protein UTRI_04883 [Ustilago trichophora]|uniref:DUF300-domain-containing protein n=1 Tax=Ustilago trichophora TaxID=86804 RepID=A0A5C3EFT2_9BASI|nr:uncharacterized protein UTRI_04883 [Ustilago trichophora]
MVNMTCPTIPDKPSDPKPFFENGNIDFKAHDVGWLICGIMALIATISSVWLIWKHLTYYTCPQQQRHIVRLLVMVPIYAIVSFMSYLFYHEALYYQTIRDCYEAVLVTSFFYLILAYTGDTRAEQHAVFRNIDIKDRFWVWPLGSWKYKPEGLHFLWLMKICVLQYAIIRPFCTFVAVGTEYFGYYCLHSWMPWFTHVWCALFISISVTVAMYCLIQLYIPVRKLVDPYKPILKFLAIKTIVFLTFWQDTLLSFLVSFGAIKETEYFTAEQIQAGINALLQCFWMLLFGFIHIKAFSYLPYRPEDRSRTTLRGKAMLDCLDFRDWFMEMKESTRYIAARSKGRNYTLAEDLRAKRHQHLLNALGKQRTANLDAEMDMEKAAMPTFWKNPEDAQFWTPGNESDFGYSGGKHYGGSDARRSSSRPSNSGGGGGDAYSPLSNPAAGRAVRQGSKLAADKSNTTASRDSHAQRAAELQRLVAELDLQQDVDQSIVGAEDHEYGYEDEKFERAGLMHGHDLSSDRSRISGKKDLDTPTKEADMHPELTQYHTPTIQLANVPSLTYDQESSSGSVRRGQDLSAVAEEVEEEEAVHGRQRSRGVTPGVGAFGIASWFGWSNNNPQEQQQPQPHSQLRANANVDASNNGYLRPGDGYLGQQYGADVTRSRTPDAEGTGWWRNYWDRVSNPGSREPSIIGGMEDEEKEPLAPARPAVMRQVTAGSWGLDSAQHQQPQPQQRSLPIPPTLKIETDTATNRKHSADGNGSSDSATSPTSRISPHVDSPLSRLIQTSRDSFSSLSREELRESVMGVSTGSPSRSRFAAVSKVPPMPAVQTVSATRPILAPRNHSLAPSSNNASVSRVTSTTTRSAPKTTTTTTTTTTPSIDAASTAYASAVQEMLSSTDSTSTRHPIVFADALVPTEPIAEEKAVERPAEKIKALPPAVGPKGKLFNLVLPSPLSPARYPYGQEGDASQQDQQGKTLISTTDREEHSAGAVDAGGSLKWANQPPKPLKPKEEPVAGVPAKLPAGKNLITVGGMSLNQAKAAKAAAEAEATEARRQRAQHRASLPIPPPPPQQQQQQHPLAAAAAPTKSILTRTSTTPEKKTGKLVLPAPSKLASIDTEDPYRAGQSANIPPSSSFSSVRKDKDTRKSNGGMGGSIATSSATKTSITGTAFEVGSIVPREAVVRASLPAGAAPLRGDYDSLRQSNNEHSRFGGKGSQVGADQRHSYTMSLNMGFRQAPQMLPAHPSQMYHPQTSQQSQQRVVGQGQFETSQRSGFVARPIPPPLQQFHPQQHPQQPFHPSHHHHNHHQGRQWNPSTPQSQPKPPKMDEQQRTSQFQFEYYRD